MYWGLSVFCVTYMLNACSDAFTPPEEAGTVNESVSSSDSEDVENASSINYLNYGQGGTGSSSSSSSGGFGFAGNGSSSGATNFGSASGGYATGGGKSDESASEDSSVSAVTYDNYSASEFQYFEKMTEPEGTYTYEGDAFALQFVAIGKFPLKYIWYKKSSAGETIVGTDSTVYSKVVSSSSDAGDYYATVEDASGNKLTSRTVTVRVRLSERPCLAGEYGKSSASLGELVPKAAVHSGYINGLVSLEHQRGSHVVDVDCQYLSTGMSESCHGKLYYQCVNARYTKIDGQCNCAPDN